MRKIVMVVVTVAYVTLMSCSAGRGCPGNGRNVGAERILSGDPKALKDAKKAGKFRH